MKNITRALSFNVINAIIHSTKPPTKHSLVLVLVRSLTNRILDQKGLQTRIGDCAELAQFRPVQSAHQSFCMSWDPRSLVIIKMRETGYAQSSGTYGYTGYKIERELVVLNNISYCR